MEEKKRAVAHRGSSLTNTVRVGRSTVSTCHDAYSPRGVTSPASPRFFFFNNTDVRPFSKVLLPKGLGLGLGLGLGTSDKKLCDCLGLSSSVFFYIKRTLDL